MRQLCCDWSVLKGTLMGGVLKLMDRSLHMWSFFFPLLCSWQQIDSVWWFMFAVGATWQLVTRMIQRFLEDFISETSPIDLGLVHTYFPPLFCSAYCFKEISFQMKTMAHWGRCEWAKVKICRHPSSFSYIAQTVSSLDVKQMRCHNPKQNLPFFSCLHISAGVSEHLPSPGMSFPKSLFSLTWKQFVCGWKAKKR